jgi:hypothetical protein
MSGRFTGTQAGKGPPSCRLTHMRILQALSVPECSPPMGCVCVCAPLRNILSVPFLSTNKVLHCPHSNKPTFENQNGACTPQGVSTRRSRGLCRVGGGVSPFRHRFLTKQLVSSARGQHRGLDAATLVESNRYGLWRLRASPVNPGGSSSLLSDTNHPWAPPLGVVARFGAIAGRSGRKFMSLTSDPQRQRFGDLTILLL